MKVQGIYGLNYKNQGLRQTNFKGEEKKYENPIDRNKERRLSVLSSIGQSAALGAVAGGVATCFIKEGASNRFLKSGIVGLGVAAASLLLTLPAKLYDAKVGAFTREKEMDVFARDKSVQTKLFEELDKQADSDEVSLEKKISNFATLEMAKKGSGLFVKQSV